MFDPQFSRAGILWTEIINFIQTAEGSIATALETFTAKQISRHPQLDAGQRKLLTHRFAIEGKVGKQTPLELFLADRSDLTAPGSHINPELAAEFRRLICRRPNLSQWLRSDELAHRQTLPDSVCRCRVPGSDDEIESGRGHHHSD
jgi:hypothetical protein